MKTTITSFGILGLMLLFGTVYGAFAQTVIFSEDFESEGSDFRTVLLRLKQSATFIAPVHQGVPFLGFRIFPSLLRLKHRNLVHFSRKFRQKERLYKAGDLSEDELLRSAQSMLGHICHADTYGMRREYFHKRSG